MTSRRAAAPLRVTERIDYALKSVLLLSLNEGSYLTTKAVAEHYGMSHKLLGSVLWSLRSAGIVTSRPGWHGGFQLARPPEAISLRAVIAAASGDQGDASRADGSAVSRVVGANGTTLESEDRATNLVAGFWRALDDQVQNTLTAFTLADLTAARRPH
jgi:Rrf2 family protein